MLQMRLQMKNGKKGTLRGHTAQNRGDPRDKGVVELSPHHFSNKERYNWFEILQLYTQNFLNEEEKNEKLRKRALQSEFY